MRLDATLSPPERPSHRGLARPMCSGPVRTQRPIYDRANLVGMARGRLGNSRFHFVHSTHWLGGTCPCLLSGRASSHPSVNAPIWAEALKKDAPKTNRGAPEEITLDQIGSIEFGVRPGSHKKTGFCFIMLVFCHVTRIDYEKASGAGRNDPGESRPEGGREPRLGFRD